MWVSWGGGIKYCTLSAFPWKLYERGTRGLLSMQGIRSLARENVSLHRSYTLFFPGKHSKKKKNPLLSSFSCLFIVIFNLLVECCAIVHFLTTLLHIWLGRYNSSDILMTKDITYPIFTFCASVSLTLFLIL